MSNKRQRTGKTEDTTDVLANALLVGAGEYTTGWTGAGATKSDKKCGVVGLTFFDMRRRGKVGDLVGICGTQGTKMPAMREHLQRAIGDKYKGIEVKCNTYPADDVSKDYKAYIAAMDKDFKKGDIVTIFTPDNTHFEIIMAAIERGFHVMATKPIVKTLEEHQKVMAAAKKHNVLVCIEVHKRYDPIYADARNQIQHLGDFGYFVSYMSQPQFQLETFKGWAGKSSDISYYLNSHHVDFHCWALQGKALPIRVAATKSTGVAKAKIGVDAEDTIVLNVTWKNLESGNVGTAVYTSSWAAAKSDRHTLQKFFYLGHKGELTVDQGRRGYSLAKEDAFLPFESCNPLFMNYMPNPRGEFIGQHGYGYLSFEMFVDAVNDINNGRATAADFNDSLPTAETTADGTAVLEAGRLSLDADGQPHDIIYDDHHNPIAIKPVFYPNKADEEKSEK